ITVTRAFLQRGVEDLPGRGVGDGGAAEYFVAVEIGSGQAGVERQQLILIGVGEGALGGDGYMAPVEPGEIGGEDEASERDGRDENADPSNFAGAERWGH